MISAVAKVVVPVDSQERATTFWTERVGFEVKRDEAYGDERWVEVGPRDGGTVLVLSPRRADEPRADVPEALPQSPVFFTCQDIRETYREMTERGVEFTAPPAETPVGWWSLFTDQDGTRYALGQW